MNQRSLRIVFGSTAMLFGTLLFFSGSFVHAQATTTSTTKEAFRGVAFPIVELGNCESKVACRAFCNAKEHMRACIAFGKSHRLISEEQATRSHAFTERLEAQGGPGGCTSPEACKTYCKEAGHNEECAEFARTIGLPLIKRIERIERLERSSSTRVTSSSLPTRPIPLPHELRKENERINEIMPPVCKDRVACRRLCRDGQGQFYNHPECVRFRELSAELEKLQGDVPPDEEDLPKDHACPDPTTCAARCENSESPYFLKSECVRYREEHPVGFAPTRSRLFFGSILQNLQEFFR